MHMGHRYAVFSLSTLLFLVPCSRLFAQKNQQQSNQQQSAPAPTLRGTSSLVFLDVTVLDKKGHPVVTGLNKEEFTITEDKKAQRIFSFEAPDTHTMAQGPLTKTPTARLRSLSSFSTCSIPALRTLLSSATRCADSSSPNRNS